MKLRTRSLRKERHRGSVYNEVIFSPDYICKPRWLWREDDHGFLTPRFRKCPKAKVGRPIPLLWHEMDRDVWLAEMALKDATITFCWMTCMAAVGLGANLVVEDLKLDHDMPIVLVAGAMFAVLPAFLCLASWMGGACWNITSLIAFAYMGDSYCNRHTVMSIIVRLMAQARIYSSQLMCSGLAEALNFPMLALYHAFKKQFATVKSNLLE